MDHCLTRRAALGAALAFTACAAIAQGAYPDHPLRIVVPQPAGGGFDFVARTLADRLGKQLGQPVVVENRPGSGTVVGTDLVAKAPADGYTLLLGSVSNLALNMGMYRNLPYDSLRDFEPLGLAVAYSYTLMARKELPQATLKEVIGHAKANPKKLNYASAGNGSGQHVIAAALWHAAGVELTHVPYRGAQAAYQDLIGGRVDLFFDLSSTARTQIDAGTVRALAVSGAARIPTQPDIPTIAQTGAAPLELESWFGLFAPAKTPPAILERLRTELARVIAMPEVTETFRKAGGKPLALSVADTRALVQKDVERWSRIVRELDIRPE
ncbi:Tripartite-type tricarboxylate transporter, receptor component TctC [Variovorax sp. CF079]|uniref:Bug family tripartite tricarboxylate transporter substrate binding protein n=1 Tax=Variovorax sp. CF079 TaxID=1882774 RepID=UPI000884912D|nr:tripartite tricarboxylate transporter substrate binding protein [Variovorax sp. CF079]SDD02034.1 Tripartite-type tricarboxylate transporter, receptor component TctC [Variovorax sp. CF079]